jgi:hypothetical protein
MKMRPLIFAHLVIAGVVQSAATYACGFEGPQMIALGSLNSVYPDALHVTAAVWQAEDDGLLPPDGNADATGPLAFYRAATAVKKFGTNLTDALPAKTGVSMSVVLIPQVMWTRFEDGPEGLTVRSHVEGPQADDLVIVTQDKVVRELVDGKLNAETAEERGLLRFYGGSEEIAAVRAALAAASKAAASSTGRTAGATSLSTSTEARR